MTNYAPEFKQPPWVIGSQKEVMEWIEATHPTKKEKKKSGRGRERKTLKNVHIQLDLDVEQTKIEFSNVFSRFFRKIFRAEKVEEHFDLGTIAEIILRALAKAKFRNTGKIIVDGTIVYNHPEVISDLRKTIDVIRNLSNLKKEGKTIEITAILSDVEKCIAKIQIKKVHRPKEHSIDIMMRGEIKSELYHTFVNYIYEKLGLQKESLANRI